MKKVLLCILFFIMATNIAVPVEKLELSDRIKAARETALEQETNDKKAQNSIQPINNEKTTKQNNIQEEK